MKTRTILLLFLSLVAVGLVCAKDRPIEMAPKGMHLYSWQNAYGSWVFALVGGTNGLRSADVIKQPANQIHLMVALERRFEELAVGQRVFWSRMEGEDFTYPEEAVRAEVIEAAKRAGVELELPKEHE